MISFLSVYGSLEFYFPVVHPNLLDMLRETRKRFYYVDDLSLLHSDG